MKKNWKSFAMGFLAAVIVLGLALPTFAAGSKINWEGVWVGDVSITLDGKTVEPKDVNGKTVEPVIYDGTTYLPVRAIASALGLGVGWDQETRTVILTTGPQEQPEPQPEPEPEEEPAPAEEPEPAEEPAPAEEPEKEPEPAAANEEYVGTYKVYKVRGQNVDELYEQMVDLYKELYGDELDPEYEEALKELRDELQNMLVLELKADGTCVFTYEEESIELKWKVEGEKIILSYEGESIEGTIKDGIVTMEMGEETIELKK